VLEEIAREYDVQTGGLDGPFLGTILLEECDFFRSKEWQVRVQIHPEPSLAPHLIDELTVSTAQIQNRPVLWNPPLKKRAKLRPDVLSINRPVFEPGPVQFLQVAW
jgi:hypothetical protein